MTACMVLCELKALSAGSSDHGWMPCCRVLCHAVPCCAADVDCILQEQRKLEGNGKNDRDSLLSLVAEVSHALPRTRPHVALPFTLSGKCYQPLTRQVSQGSANPG